ncbi:11598_t:CDS:2 [Funneliformis caledonium]|uniref:11598_t:CDS:1 n=1 Tax=Funneliformis caledonium TaxID=1117310 RepID=A0A9N9GR26_9GLOM|nr:11598_t:CDS:2 [Funneliformis caledonium]
MCCQADVWLSKLHNKNFDGLTITPFQIVVPTNTINLFFQKYFVSSTLKILDLPGFNGSKSLTHILFKTLETEDLLILNCLAIVLHDKPSSVLSTIIIY